MEFSTKVVEKMAEIMAEEMGSHVVDPLNWTLFKPFLGSGEPRQ